MQQKIMSQTEALELAMKLESSPIRDGGAGMMQIQSWLASLTVQLHDIKKGKEAQEDLGFTICQTKGHTKDNCPSYMNYISSGTHNPLSTHKLPQCRICHTRGHHDEDCLYLQNIVSTPASYFCKFCKIVGHDEKDCRAYQLLKEKTVYTYLMKNNGQAQDEQE